MLPPAQFLPIPATSLPGWLQRLCRWNRKHELHYQQEVSLWLLRSEWRPSPRPRKAPELLLRNFLSIHYKFNSRIENPFWRACQADVVLHGTQDIVGGTVRMVRACWQA
ncbi:MAG: tryptophan 7-halogenase [Verrucomicrobia bacterium]|nr:tryptophan 7-halogenase [Verrucomicrobiota bacterium]